ncbi:MAG: hypothetical protein QOG40_1024 [Solirubrobacteraceae bacterium]|nr:hypothetical protein [Solirubrobacteraceae bacterium]
MPGSGGVAHRTPVDLPSGRARTAPLGLLVAGALLVVWLLVAPRTPDLAAAAYRLDLFKHLGLAVYDEHWYAGHDLPGYSVLFGPLAWVFGLRVVGALSVLASVACFEALAVAAYGRSARWAAVLFALAAVGDVWIGRLAFALGVSFALGAVLAHSRGRPRLAAVLALASAAASPVAGVLLGLIAVTDAIWRRSALPLLALGIPAAVVVLALALLFPEGGFQPYPTLSFAATVAVVAAFAWGLPRGHGRLRLGAALYLLACVVFLLVRTPMGSNIERYAVLLAGPLLLCALLSALQSPTRAPLRLLAPAVIALCAWAAWAAWGPLRETLAVAGSQSTGAAYYSPVERFLDEHAHEPVRLEVPLTRTHWETAQLAPRVSLARGWEKQLDARFNAVLLAPRLTPSGYERWLREQAVSYVALPDAKLDPPSAHEGDLIRSGLPYLHEVFSSRHWRIYAVRAPTPLASGPGRLTSLGHESFALSATSPGSFLVRVHFTRYWTIARGDGCVSRTAGGWTRVLARAPGPLLVQARFSLGRALGVSGSCHSE